ncbi:sigma factor [Flavonifractor sp. AGMB03687]|uniref:sigma-70 family RNA polymerase sigma factor n=1 Tax=Flavonifractor sp. AGMB03687 TaxID=2785133 RepID=UPI001ADF60D3|nr:sigma factor [Flavonifractor sp. AGMB03687]
MSMYLCDTPCPSNEQLAQRIQDGDPEAASCLLSQNEGYLTMLAASYCEQFSQDFLVDDLKQEGALALLDAAQRFDVSMGTRLLTYATPAIETAMKDCAAQSSFSLSLPLDRYYQLRQVAFLYAAHEQDTEANLLTAIQAKLEVSAKVAKRLLEEYRTVFQIESLGERVFDISFGGDPAKAYDRFMRRTLLLQLMEEVLKPRELNLVRCYLGIGQPNEQGMTFQELAIRLNYNGPSGAEKAYKSAIRKLRKQRNGGVYGHWLSIQKAIQAARREASTETGYSSPQSTWLDEQELIRGFLRKTAALRHVYHILHTASVEDQKG